ncbi:hypothetical protein CEXT_215031 [Caerostris extrusa]|uniref:Uncharacterized protein n=1 Tax=Caerostris extrusa TaxID=172846 RepID=A0AAV4UMA5_CAEEX|nr:hypothetical protein CEXT_215031 [Caerostris extrusa]
MVKNYLPGAGARRGPAQQHRALSKRRVQALEQNCKFRLITSHLKKVKGVNNQESSWRSCECFHQGSDDLTVTRIDPFKAIVPSMYQSMEGN